MLLTHNIRLNTQTDGQMASPEEKPNSLKKKKRVEKERKLAETLQVCERSADGS